MSRNLHIWLVFICLAMVCGALAREETMEQRKKRIARRYLRERGVIAGSVAEVPVESTEADEELIVDNTAKMKDAVKMQPSTLPSPKVVRRPPPRRKEEMNWLLEADKEQEAEDSKRLDQNPFDLFSNELQQPGRQYEDVGKPKTAFDFFRTSDSTSEQREKRSEIIKDSWTLDFGAQQRRQYDTKPKSRFPASSARNGRQDTGRPVYYNGKELKEQPAYDGTYGSGSSYKSPSTGSDGTVPQTWSSRSSMRREPQYRLYQKDTARQPYQPLQRARADRKKQDEFKRVRPYEQWKKASNNDPMKDNSFINEVMPKINNNR